MVDFLSTNKANESPPEGEICEKDFAGFVRQNKRSRKQTSRQQSDLETNVFQCIGP